MANRLGSYNLADQGVDIAAVAQLLQSSTVRRAKVLRTRGGRADFTALEETATFVPNPLLQFAAQRQVRLDQQQFELDGLRMGLEAHVVEHTVDREYDLRALKAEHRHKENLARMAYEFHQTPEKGALEEAEEVDEEPPATLLGRVWGMFAAAKKVWYS